MKRKSSEYWLIIFIAICQFTDEAYTFRGGLPELGQPFASISLKERAEQLKAMLNGCPGLAGENVLITNCTRTVKKVVSPQDCSQKVPMGTKATFKCAPGFAAPEKHKSASCSRRKWSKSLITCKTPATTTTTTTTSTESTTLESTTVDPQRALDLSSEEAHTEIQTGPSEEMTTLDPASTEAQTTTTASPSIAASSAQGSGTTTTVPSTSSATSVPTSTTLVANTIVSTTPTTTTTSTTTTATTTNTTATTTTTPATTTLATTTTTTPATTTTTTPATTTTTTPTTTTPTTTTTTPTTTTTTPTTTTVSTTPTTTPRPDGYSSVSTHGLYKAYITPMAYSQARSQCITDGGYLAIFQNTAEAADVFAYARNKGLPDLILAAYTDAEVEGTFKDSLGGAMSLAVGGFAWAIGNPDNYANNEDCTEMFMSTKRLNDLPCSYSRAFICEK